MFCTRCGAGIGDEVRYCSQCGQPTGYGTAQAYQPYSGGLSIPAEGRKIGGVCAGFARYLGIDVTLVRVLWLTLSLLTGVGFIAYLVAWLIMPKDPSPVPAAVRREPDLARQT
ncbi:MAG: PspC domain-containing protein [Bryobacterales bacterium]|nr:PspC domain-containing protein [Bryobacterales bacterium]